MESDGKTIVVANEGEPNDYYGTPDGVDPEGSISIIRLADDKKCSSKQRPVLLASLPRNLKILACVFLV